MIIYLRVFKLQSGHEIASGTIKGHVVKYYITVKCHDNIPKGICHRADTKLHLKPSRENKSDTMKARVVILVCDTLS